LPSTAAPGILRHLAVPGVLTFINAPRALAA